MANRFDVGTPQKYVSIYPFQELAAIGEKLNARAGQAQQKMSAIEDAISKMEVEDQVITEGSTLGDQYTPGVQWASTGYGQFKNNLLNTVKTAHEDLTALWQAGEISISDLERQSNILNKNILKDYNKLSLAAENSKVIKEINKKYRENQDVPNSPFVLNTLAKAGSEFLKDPFALNYVGAPIAKLLTEMDYVNKYASGFKDSDIRQFQTAADKNGYIDYGKITGVTADRVKAVAQDVDTDPEIGSQLKQQAYRDVANMMDPNNSNFNAAVQKQYEGYKNQFIQSVLAKAVGQTTTHNLKFDRIGYDKQKEEEIKKRLTTSGDVIPTGTPLTIIQSNFPNLGKYIKEENGKLSLNTPNKFELIKEFVDEKIRQTNADPELSNAQKQINIAKIQTQALTGYFATHEYGKWEYNYLNKIRNEVESDLKKLATETGVSANWNYQALNKGVHPDWDKVLNEASDKYYHKFKFVNGVRKYNTAVSNSLSDDILKYGTSSYSFYDVDGNPITEDINNLLLTDNKPNKTLTAVANGKVPVSNLPAHQITYFDKNTNKYKVAYAHPLGEVQRNLITASTQIKDQAVGLNSLLTGTPPEQERKINSYLNKNNLASENLIDNVSENQNISKKLIVRKIQKENPDLNTSEINNNVKIIGQNQIGNSYVATVAYRESTKDNFKIGIYEIKPNGEVKFRGDTVNADEIQTEQFMNSSEGANLMENELSKSKIAERNLPSSDEEE